MYMSIIFALARTLPTEFSTSKRCAPGAERRIRTPCRSNSFLAFAEAGFPFPPTCVLVHSEPQSAKSRRRSTALVFLTKLFKRTTASYQ